MRKSVLFIVDGLRPDSLETCGNGYIPEILSRSIYTLNATTVMPSVTLPCHMSLFHSVPCERHGILTNTYVPMVRPVRGICEVLRAAGKACSFFYNWEELKDLSRPDSLAYANYVSGHIYGYEKANPMVTDAAIAYINGFAPDFTFVYLGDTDAVGHGHGWMSPEYLGSVSRSFDCIKKLIDSIPEDYCVIVTADHGGHSRGHGSDMPEDMLIPMIFYNRKLSETKLQAQANIIDVAPTITALLDVGPDADWEGKALDEVVTALKQ